MRIRKGYLFQKTKGGVWYVRTKVNRKAVVESTQTRNLKDAERRRDEIMLPYALGDENAVLKAVANRIADNEANLARSEADRRIPPLISSAWDLFMQSTRRPDSGSSTMRQYTYEWKRFQDWLARLHPEIERMDEVTTAMATEYTLDLTAVKVSPSTYNQHKNLLKMVWRVLALEEENGLSSNPWTTVTNKKLNAEANRKQPLTPAQYETLLAVTESDPDLRDLFILLAWTGLRLADAVLMTWAKVDFAKCVISLVPMKTSRRTGKTVHIPIFPEALGVLNRRQDGRPLNPKGCVFPDLAALYRRDAAVLSKRITKAFEKAGIQTTEERAGRSRLAVVFGAHSLRHFFVTEATEAGMPTAMIKSITGHATDAMVGRYQHLAKEMAEKMARNIHLTAKKPPALPPATKDPAKALAALKRKIRKLGRELDSETAASTRDKLLALAKS